MKFVQYIHIPKCGGNSVNKALEDKGLESHDGHTTYRYYVKYREPATHYVTTVRNPWDRAVSCYEYFKIETQTFEQFIQMRQGDMHKGHAYNGQQCRLITWAAQTHWLTDENNKLDSKIQILRLEQIQHDWDMLLRSWDMKSAILPHINITTRRPYQEYYNNKLKDQVETAWHNDIVNFNYSFD